MQLQEKERRAVNEAALIQGDTVEVCGFKLRRMSLGSLIQLQRIGNPYARLGEVSLGGDRGMWDELGVSAGDVFYFTAEFLWVHCASAEDVRRLVFGDEEARREAVERFAEGVNIHDLGALQATVLGEVTAVGAGMVEPEAHEGADEGPLAIGPAGGQQC